MPAATLTKRTLSCLESLNRHARDRFLALLENIAPILEKEGCRAEVICGLRSWKQQAAIYAQGRSVPGRIISHAPPGSSWHNYGLAVDLGLFKTGVYLDERDPRWAERLYKLIMPEAEKLGIECGGRWTGKKQDLPHFQFRPGIKDIAAARTKFQSNGMDVDKMLP